MKTIAIISEYNPFHNGHDYLINKAKEQFGNDTAVIAIMSGNYMQRGELAIADKTVRARAAVDCGVNLVLEIPFPFSVSSAEFYAKSGVHIANSIGIVDHLVFGSECGDIDLLCTVAQNMLSDKYSCALNTAIKSPSEKGIGYPTLCAKIYNEIFGDFKSTLTESNNTLALEYIKALIKSNSTITPVTFRRIGAGYHDKIDSSHKYQSATALREIISDCIDSARKYMPDMSINTYLYAVSQGLFPSDQSKLDSAIISYFRLNSPDAKCNIHDASGGLYNRLCDGSRKTNNINALLAYADTKKYTSSRILRAIWYSYLGVTSSEITQLPSYTQVLAMDDVGKRLLRSISKQSEFPVITKPSNISRYGETVIHQKNRANIADSVYMLTLGASASADHAITFTPYVKK